MKDEIVRARIDAELKAQAAAVFSAVGLHMSDAIRLFLKQAVRKGGMPFPIRDPHVRVASGKHLWGMKRRSQRQDQDMIARGDVPAEAMLFVRPHHFEGARLEWPKVSLSDD
jgi:addiction module RelB/DinJ family antitoxin